MLVTATGALSGPATPPPPPSLTGDPIRDLDQALEGGWTTRADSLQTARYHLLPTDLRQRMVRLIERPAAEERPPEALRNLMELRVRAYQRAYGQSTLRQSLDLLDRLSPAERRSWARFEQLRDRGDTLFQEQSWAKADSVSRVAAAGLERLGDAYGAGRAWTRSGACAEMSGDLARAVSQGERAIGLLERAEAPFEIVRVLHNLATAFETLGRVPEAEAGLERAVRESRRVPGAEGEFLESSARSLLAAIQIRRGRYPDALEHYRRSRDISARLATPAAVADDLRGMGHLHSLLGRLELALAEYDTALVMAERSEDSQLAGLCLRDRGDVLIELGRLDAAAASYRMALVRHAEVKDERSAAETLYRMGRLEARRGNHRAGRAAVDSALAVATRLGDAANIGAYLAELGELSLAFSRYPEAHGYFTRALDQARKIGQREQEQDVLRSLGRLEELLGRSAAARGRYEEALRLARATGRRAREISSGLALGELDLSEMRTAEALHRAREAGMAARRSGAAGLELEAGSLEVRADLAAGRLVTARRRLTALLAAPHAESHPLLRFELERTGARLELHSGRPELALAGYRAAANTLEDLVETVSAAELRAGLQTGRFEVYRELVGLLLRLGRVEEAFEWADRSRARSLVDRLTGGPPAPPATADPEAARQRLRLQVLARNLHEEERQGGRSEAIRSLRAELAAAQRAYNARLAWSGAGAAAPRSGERVRPEAVSVLSPLRARLGVGTAFVEYFQTDSTLAAFVVTRDAIRVERLDGAATALEARVRTFRDALEHDFLHPETPRDWRTPGRALHADLWQPLERHLGEVTLVLVAPEGALRLLPFAALVAPDVAAGAPPRLLAETRALAMTPSAAALLAAPAPPAGAPMTLLAVAAGSVTRRTGLKAVEREARDVAARFPGPTRRILSGSHATEPEVLEALPSADWIHFACHAHLNPEAPRFSWLELVPSAAADGRLEVQEVEGLHLRARLVTLSACETAVESGEGALFPPGEELIGMVRAFMSAGASAVVASLWPVPDAEVATLMSAFYAELARTPSEPARALNRAQRSWLSRSTGRGRLGHPYLGAAFLLVGRPD